MKSSKRACLFRYVGYTAPKRFNDIVKITAVIVFLALIAMLSMISLCLIAALGTRHQRVSEVRGLIPSSKMKC